jgi:hypothetical protein
MINWILYIKTKMGNGNAKQIGGGVVMSCGSLVRGDAAFERQRQDNK